MPEIPREKGQFVQPGAYVPVIAISGSAVTHDGTVDFDQQLLIEEYPILYEIIGDAFLDAGKGDVLGTHFRTPSQSANLVNDTNVVWRIRY